MIFAIFIILYHLKKTVSFSFLVKAVLFRYYTARYSWIDRFNQQTNEGLQLILLRCKDWLDNSAIIITTTTKEEEEEEEDFRFAQIRSG